MERVIKLTKTKGEFKDKNAIVFGKDDKVFLSFESDYDLHTSVITLKNGEQKIVKSIAGQTAIPDEILFSGWLSVRIDMFLEGVIAKTWQIFPVRLIEAAGEVQGAEEAIALNERIGKTEEAIERTNAEKVSKADFEALKAQFAELAEKHNKLAEIVGALKEN